MQEKKEVSYVRWGLTALCVIFASILGVVIFIDLPGFFAVIKSLIRILSPLIFGAVFAFLMNPLMKLVEKPVYRLLEKRKKKKKDSGGLARAIGILFAVVVFLLLIYGFFAMLLPQLYESILGIVNNADDYYKSVETWVTKLLDDNPNMREYADIAMEKAYEFINERFSGEALLNDMQKLLTTVTSSVVAFVRAMANMLIGLVASIYILWSKDIFSGQAKKIVVALFKPSKANHILHLARETNKIFNGFVIGKIIDSAIIGVLCYIGLLILRMPYPILVATIVGVTNVIPFFGPIIGAIPSALLILLVNPLQAFYFVIFVIILQQLDGNVIGPKILGNTVGISGFWVLISITIATSLFGFAGMILGVPVFAVIYMLVSDGLYRMLRRKNRPVETENYMDIRYVEELDSACKAEQEESKEGASEEPDLQPEDAPTE